MERPVVYVGYEVDEYGYRVWCFDRLGQKLYELEGNNLDSNTPDERYHPDHPDAISEIMLDLDARDLSYFVRDKFHENYDVVYIGGVASIGIAYNVIDMFKDKDVSKMIYTPEAKDGDGKNTKKDVHSVEC